MAATRVAVIVLSAAAIVSGTSTSKSKYYRHKAEYVLQGTMYAGCIFKENAQATMPLHCPVIRPKLLNVQYISFLNPVLTRFLRIKITILVFFYFLPLLALWS